MEQPAYYAIIPANVRYDKNLTPNAKLLYGEITALCNEKGFCLANNEYFSELYGVSKTSITKWVNSLVENGYIYRNFTYKDGTKEIANRCLTIVVEVLNKSCVPPLTKVVDPPKEKLRDNNTINNTINNTKDIYVFFENIWNSYPVKKGKGSISDSQKKKLYKIGYQEIRRAVDRYVSEQKENGTDIKFYKNGSTFFNSGYVDYLDENYTKPRESVKYLD